MEVDEVGNQELRELKNTETQSYRVIILCIFEQLIKINLCVSVSLCLNFANWYQKMYLTT